MRPRSVSPTELLPDEETSPGRALPARMLRARRGMVIGSALAITYACALLVVASLSADLGFLSYQGGPIVLVDRGGSAAAAGVTVGDVVVAIDGVALDDLRDRSAALDAIAADEDVTLTLARGEARRDVSFRVPRRMPIASGAGVALGAVLLLLAVFADRGNRHELPQAFFRQAVVYVVFLAGAFSLDVAIAHPALFIPWLYSMTLAAPLTCRFMIRFPNGRRWFSRGEHLLLYGPPVVLATLLAVNHVLFLSGQWTPPGRVSKVLGGVAITMAATYLTVGAIARTRRLRAKRAEVDPLAAKWLHVGGVFMVVPMLASLVWASRDLPGFISGGFRPFVAVAMVGGSACVVLAMSRVPFGELDRLWRRSSGYVLATFFAAGIYLGVIGLLGGAASSLSGGSFQTALGATLAAAVLFGPVRARLQGMVDERFARDRTRARRLLREAAEAAVAVLDIDELQRGVVDRVRQALAADGVALYVADGDAWRCEVTSGEVSADAEVSGGAFGRALDGALTARAPRPIGETETVVVPLAVDERRPAALVVAPRDGERLLDEDHDLLSTVAANLVVAIGNARAHRELREMADRLEREVELAEKRRREIARLKERLEEENRALLKELVSRQGKPPVIGKGLADTFDLVHKVSRSDATVLVRGETGVGKELVARAIHAASPRRSGPFVVLDCGAIAPGLIESALFGHEKGAFTGAVRTALGAFRQAHGGTIFLDELGELPLELQPKLLRVLQEREVQPVGADRPVPVDVRVVCGTNRDLHAEVASGAFREDLLYRLQVVEIAVPPLRARKGDIAELAAHFLADAAERAGRTTPKTLAPDALELILDYDWPGNVRELEHALEAAGVYAEGDEIRAADLPVAEKHWRRKGERAMAETGRTRFPSGTGEHTPGAVTRSGIKQTLEELERERLAAVMVEHGGNKSRAAKVLGLSRGALLRRLKRYGLEVDEGGGVPEN